ncbi:MAG: hypothetical protein ACK45B_03545 [Limisphaerales bacterium]|jgi:spermidine synthase
MRVIRTRTGLRLSQHGVVISELRTTPGPTHSVFDVLAAAMVGRRPGGRVGLLGFAGGGMMAPLAALGFGGCLETVDLDGEAFALFQQHCPHWAGRVRWQHGDAVAWLRRQRKRFDLLVEDLSVPQAGDVVKPAVSWTKLPCLVRQRLHANGMAVFNLLPPLEGSFAAAMTRVAAEFPVARVVMLEEYENRLLLAGRELPSARELARQLDQQLRRLGSRQAGRVSVRKWGA